ncbi:MAG: hypothetical protein B7Z67_05835, partial [Acidiphilium sp. 21-60-14]
MKRADAARVGLALAPTLPGLRRRFVIDKPRDVGGDRIEPFAAGAARRLRWARFFEIARGGGEQ